MTIDWNHFTPGASLAGGILIGLAVALMILANGRIAGISGILAGLANRNRHERFWRVAFIAGIVAAPWLYALFFPLPDIDYGGRSWALLILAGLAVGFGSRLGSGCTSGHGVCGLSRLSVRSVVATTLFIVFGALTVFIVRHLAGG